VRDIAYATHGQVIAVTGAGPAQIGITYGVSLVVVTSGTPSRSV
jgi:hypothetical protein